MITNNYNYQLLHRVEKEGRWKQDIQHTVEERLDPSISMQESAQKRSGKLQNIQFMWRDSERLTYARDALRLSS